MALSELFEDELLDHILGVGEWPFDATVFLALGTDASPNKTTFTEVGAGIGYTRQAIAFTAAGTDGVTVNSAGTLTFGPCTTTSWGMLKSWAIFDTVSSGMRIMQGALTDQTKTVAVGDSVTVAAGAIQVTLTTTPSCVSDVFSEDILDHILGTTTMGAYDTTLFLALGSDTTPSRTVFTEICTAGTLGYNRQAVTFNAAGTDGIAENAAGTLTFGPNITTNWGAIKSWAVYDTVTGGVRRLQGALTDQTKIANIGDSVTVAAGAIVITAG